MAATGNEANKNKKGINDHIKRYIIVDSRPNETVLNQFFETYC